VKIEISVKKVVLKVRNPQLQLKLELKKVV
jgi:hypothetical protein